MAFQETPKNEEFETNIASDREGFEVIENESSNMATEQSTAGHSHRPPKNEEFETKIASDREEFEVTENESSNMATEQSTAGHSHRPPKNEEFVTKIAICREEFVTKITIYREEFEVIENESSKSDSTSAVSSETVTAEKTFDRDAFSWMRIPDFLRRPRDFGVGSSVASESKVRTKHEFWLSPLLVIFGILILCLLPAKEIASCSIETSPIKSQFNQLVLITYAETVGEIPLAIAVRNYTVGATFNLHEVKQASAEQLKSGLSVRNVWVVRAVARHYDDVDLLEVTQNFIRDHMNETYGSNEWEKSMKRDEETAMKMLRLLADG